MRLNIKKGWVLLLLLRFTVVMAVTIAVVIGACFIFLVVKSYSPFGYVPGSALMRTWFTRFSGALDL